MSFSHFIMSGWSAGQPVMMHTMMYRFSLAARDHSLPASLPAYVPAYLPTSPPACMLACLAAGQRASLLACHLPASLIVLNDVNILEESHPPVQESNSKG